jgi:hypothetical protein
VRSWRTADGVVTRTSPPRPEGNNPGALHPACRPAGVCALALSHGEERLAVSFLDGCVQLLRVTPTAFVVTHTLVGHRDAAACLRLSKDGGLVVAGGAEGCLRAWRPGGMMPQLPAFGRAACLTASTRTPGCVPANLQRVIGTLVSGAGKEVQRRGAAVQEKIGAFIADKRAQHQHASGRGGGAAPAEVDDAPGAAPIEPW